MGVFYEFCSFLFFFLSWYCTQFGRFPTSGAKFDINLEPISPLSDPIFSEPFGPKISATTLWGEEGLQTKIVHGEFDQLEHEYGVYKDMRFIYPQLFPRLCVAEIWPFANDTCKLKASTSYSD